MSNNFMKPLRLQHLFFFVFELYICLCFLSFAYFFLVLFMYSYSLLQNEWAYVATLSMAAVGSLPPRLSCMFPYQITVTFTPIYLCVYSPSIHPTMSQKAQVQHRAAKWSQSLKALKHP